MLRTLLALVLGLYLFIIGLVTFVAYSSLQSSRESSRNTLVLCALGDNARESITERRAKIANEQDILKHPNTPDHAKILRVFGRGVVLKAITDDQTALASQRRNAKALDSENC